MRVNGGIVYNRHAEDVNLKLVRVSWARGRHAALEQYLQKEGKAGQREKHKSSKDRKR